MHELAVCQALLSQVAEVALAHQASAVASVTVRIGPLSGVEARLLRQAWPIASAGSSAADAELRILELPLRVRCETCGAETDASVNRLLCSACGDWHTQVISGDELLLERVELVRATPPASASAASPHPPSAYH
jgi:hydrogenase nickel incorporation protein HypA/HybF